MVTAAQDQRDTADVDLAQVEAGADRGGAPAKEDSALPSRQTSLSELVSSEKSAVLSKQTASPKQTTSERGEHWDLQLALVGEGQITEQMEMRNQDVIQVANVLKRSRGRSWGGSSRLSRMRSW